MKLTPMLFAALLGGLLIPHSFAGSSVATSGTTDGKDNGTAATIEDWRTDTISPVTNPLFFEYPQIRTEVRPIFMYHRIDDDFLTKGGLIRVYALQLRYAVNDRLAIIATKDGYINFEPTSGLQKHDGWADIGVGVKYALIDNRESRFILTPGVKFNIPFGQHSSFPGHKQRLRRMGRICFQRERVLRQGWDKAASHGKHRLPASG